MSGGPPGNKLRLSARKYFFASLAPDFAAVRFVAWPMKTKVNTGEDGEENQQGKASHV